MITTGTWHASQFIINHKSNCLTFSLEKREGTQVVAFDAAGRLWTCMQDGISYRRGLDGKIVAKWIDDLGIRHRRWLDEPEGQSFEASSHNFVRSLLLDWNTPAVTVTTSLSKDTLRQLELIVAFSRDDYQRDVAYYHQVYQPVGILPPDQYMAVVLQATLGCSFNGCTFCDFYRDRPFHIRSVEEFSHHIDQVKEFLGAGMSLRRTVFMGDANALVIPMPKLVPLMEVINRKLNVESLGGIFAFLDGFSGEKKTQKDYGLLKALGLQRVYIGMESGSKDLLRLLNKPGTPQDTLLAVRNMKAAGLPVGIIVLLGAGGMAYQADHIRETAKNLNAMQLDMDDMIYFSQLIEHEGMQYTRDAFDMHLQPLTERECVVQQEEIETRLRFSASGGVPHISRYDIREFVY
jgi:hypothetical protein